MSELRFYHLQKSTVNDVLPILLQKILDKGIKLDVIISGNVEDFSQNLWENGASDSFLANDVGNDITPDSPIAIYNNVGLNVQDLRKTRFFVDEIKPELILGADLICFMFNGNEDRIVQNARALWKELSHKAEYQLIYYSQDSTGMWKKK